jgi:hypothetical protein
MSKLKIFSRLMAIGVVLSLLMTACYNYDDETTVDDLDITLTYYDTSFNFQQYTTFAIRDSVGLIEDNMSDSDEADFYKPGGASDQVRDMVIEQFTSLGYTQVENDDDFDFGINLVVAIVNNTYTAYPGWWYGYYDYYYYYWGGWYPYYPYYPWGGYYSYTYQSGTILIEMADGQSIRDYRAWADGKTENEIENADPDDVPDVYFRWQGLINGVAGTYTTYDGSRVEKGIDEAFAQSPYLQKN